MTGSDASVGDWARIEGTPNDPNPDKPFAKMESPGLFNQEGRLNPAVTILGEFCVFVSRYCLGCPRNFKQRTYFPLHTRSVM